MCRLHPSSSLIQATKRSSYYDNEIPNAPPPSPDDGLSEDFGLAACIEPQTEGKQSIVHDVTVKTGSCKVHTEEIITSLLESSNDWWDLGESYNKPAEEIRDDVEKPPDTTVQEEPLLSELDLTTAILPDQQISSPETSRETNEENALSTSASLLTSENSSIDFLRDSTEVAHECKSENEISKRGRVSTCSLGKEAFDEASDVSSEVLTSGSVRVHEMVASKTDIDWGSTLNEADTITGNVDGEIEINESMAMGFPQSCRKAVACMLHAAKLATQVLSLPPSRPPLWRLVCFALI